MNVKTKKPEPALRHGDVIQSGRGAFPGDGLRFALFGDPVGHSLSPAMHRAAYASMGLAASYEAFRVADAGEIVPLMRSLDLDGASVTIPHKEGIMAHLDEVTAAARTIGAVNTIHRRGEIFVGDNTDWLGLLQDLQERIPIQGSSFAILGAGGMARAAAFALVSRGGGVTIFNRTLERGAALARDFQCPARPLAAAADFRADALINTTPVGLHPHANRSPVPPESLPNFRFVMDVVYNPRNTRLLREAAAAGCVPIDGVGLLVHQGAEQIRIWTGRQAPTALMRQVVLAALPE
ncbi:MAG: shikimate dehydrogenase [Pseudomonadota bacterium]|nr:shikimate dehydrogenase [Pseudomonadota bacterium]